MEWKSSGASSGGDSGPRAGSEWAGWWGMSPAPSPPGALPSPMQEGFGKGYTKGWHEGHSAGFQKGYQSCAQDVYGDARLVCSGKGSGKREPESESEAEEEKAVVLKKKKKKGSGWKEWRTKYTDFDKDDTEYFYTRLGGSQTIVYPQEIQEELLKAKDARDSEGVSQDKVYDMTGGYVYKLRIFGGTEQADWEEKLSEIKAADGQKDEGILVGAQWDMKRAKYEPPETFEKEVKYRPIFLTGPDWQKLSDITK